MKKHLFKHIMSVISVSMVVVLLIGTTVMGADKVTIRFMNRDAGTDSISMVTKALLKEFEQQNPNVIIQNDSIAEENTYLNKLKADIATGNPPNIFYFPGVAAVTDWAKAGILMDLTPVIEGDKEWSGGFVDGSFEIWNLETYGAKGHWAVPTSYWPEVMFYNTELFEKAGITKAPETMDDLYDVIAKLKAANIIPWGAGAKDIWRTGHIFNNIIYRSIGVNGMKAIGTRQAKWTDPDVVAALGVLLDLKNRGAFEKGFEGIDYGTEQAGFQSGKYAMVCNGAWAIGQNQVSPFKDKFSFFVFPYFKEKPQFKDDTVLFPVSLMVKSKMEGLEKEMTIKLLKFFTSKAAQERKLREAQAFPSRKDVNPDAMDLIPLTKAVIKHMGTIKSPGGDYADWDTCNPLLEKSRAAIVGMLLGNTPEQAAQQIQAEIDKCNEE
jgi:raffinose/stachyose/melibiose transport system substrate-binding protein